MPAEIHLHPIGTIASPLRDPDTSPRQGDEGGPDAWIELDERHGAALAGLQPGDRLIVLTWLDQADRSLLQVRPRRDGERALTGVFATRSPHRPNPIGLHPAELRCIEGHRLRVGPIEALDGTPVLDIKPELGAAR